MSESSPGGTQGVSPVETAKFNALASRWWDRRGPMRPLHAMNPARIGWILSHTARRFPSADGVRLLDVGCGAGIAAEAFARERLQKLLRHHLVGVHVFNVEWNCG